MNEQKNVVVNTIAAILDVAVQPSQPIQTKIAVLNPDTKQVFVRNAPVATDETFEQVLLLPALPAIQYRPQPKVLLFTNLQQRDWQVDSILATELRKLNFEVRQADFLPHSRQHILFYKPDIIIGPEVRCEYTVDIAANCSKWGVVFVAKRTEGGAARAAWDKMGKDEKATVVSAWPYDVDLEIVWSQDFADLVAEFGWLKKEKIFAVGAMPFDAYFNEPIPPRPPGRKAILFATGWGHADRNPHYNVPEAPFESSIHADAYNRHVKGRGVWIEMLKKAYNMLPGWDFFIRPKVGEYPKPYQDALGGRVKIVMPCPAKIALVNTDVLIHAGSTMGIEAHLMNMPAFSFCGLINQVPGYEYPHVSPDTENADELLGWIRKCDLGKSNANPESIKKLEKDFYGTIDGKACQRAAQRIKEIPLRPTSVPDVWPESLREYDVPGAAKQTFNWICEACGRITYMLEPRDMAKCLHCGISLARRLPPEQIVTGQIRPM